MSVHSPRTPFDKFRWSDINVNFSFYLNPIWYAFDQISFGVFVGLRVIGYLFTLIIILVSSLVYRVAGLYL